MDNTYTKEETSFIDCLTCDQIKEDITSFTGSTCVECGNDYLITGS